MGLIFFTYFFAVSLFVNSSYLAFHKSNRINVLLNKITVPASLVALCIAVSIHLVFYKQIGLQRIISTATLFFMLLTSYHIVDMALVLSELKTYKIMQKVNTVVHLAGIGLIVFYVGRFQWNPLKGFYFVQRDVFPGMSGIRLFQYIYVFFTSAVSIAICFIKIFLLIPIP